MRTRLISALLFVLAALLQVSAQDTWIVAESKNFRFYSNDDQKALEKTVDRLEKFRRAFGLLFPDIRLNDPVETKVFYFRDSKSFRPFLPKQSDGQPDTAIVGYFLATESSNYIALSNESGQNVRGETIFHEYVHYLLNNNFPRDNMPAWLNEGLAEFYSTIRIEDSRRISFGNLIDSHIMFLRQAKPIPSQRLFEFGYEDIHTKGDSNRSVFYAQSWALVHYLSSIGKLDKVGEFVARVGESKDHKKSFESVFGVTYEEVDIALEAYVKKKRFTRQIATLKNDLVIDNAKTFGKISHSTALAELGSLSFHKGDYFEAESMLRKSLEVNEKEPLANASLGLLRLKEGKHDKAREFLEKAVRYGSDDFYAQYSFGYVLSRIGMDDRGFVLGYSKETSDKIRRAATEAIRLRPDYVPAYNLLAFVNLVSGSNLKESISYLQKVLRIQPGNDVAWLTLAQIYVREGRLDEAEQIAKRILRTKPERETKSTADLVIDSVARAREIEKENAKLEKLRKSGAEVPAVVVVRDDLSEEDIAKIQLEREISVINQSLVKLERGERRLVGYVQKVTCSRSGIRFSIGTKDGKQVSLRSKDFRSLRLLSLRENIGGQTIGCDAQLSKYLAVFNYMPTGNVGGTLRSISFVPEHFRIKSADQIALDTKVMVIKNPDGSGTTQLEVRDAPEDETEEQIRARERVYQNVVIKASLRKPKAGEKRSIGKLSRIGCATGSMIFYIQTPSGEQGYFTRDYQNLDLVIYVENASSVRIGCGITPPEYPVVITHRDSEGIPGSDREIVWVEVVPVGFKLN